MSAEKSLTARERDALRRLARELQDEAAGNTRGCYMLPLNATDVRALLKLIHAEQSSAVATA